MTRWKYGENCGDLVKICVTGNSSITINQILPSTQLNIKGSLPVINMAKSAKRKTHDLWMMFPLFNALWFRWSQPCFDETRSSGFFFLHVSPGISFSPFFMRHDLWGVFPLCQAWRFLENPCGLAMEAFSWLGKSSNFSMENFPAINV